MADQILDVLLAEIEAPDGWNARSGAWADDPADPTSDDGGYEGLKASMQEAKRNDEPVLLRPWTPIVVDGRYPFKYVLVDGFRRYRVAKELCWSTIRATVEPLTDFEARRRNLQAQTGRIKHKSADLAWGLWELKKLAPKLTDKELANLVGISHPYTHILRKIMQDVDPKVTSAWRASSVRIDSVHLLKISRTPTHEHWKQWQALEKGAHDRPSPGFHFQQDHQLEKRAKELGRTIGTLQRLDVVYAASHGRLTPALAMITKKELSADQLKKLETIMSDGFAEGLAGKDA